MAFKLNYYGTLAYLTIPSFEKTGLVKHGFSTRLGGVSKPPYQALNLGLRKEDSRTNVLENYRLFCEALGISPENLVTSDQVHKDKIHVATLKDKGIFRESDIKDIDALITKDKQVALVTYYADCVPLFFLDLKTPAVGLAHAGWRGTVSKIGQKTVLKMMKEFGTLPENMLVGIGPCINSCCYEVDALVVDKVKKAFVYWDELIQESGQGKWMLDLVLTNKRQLEEVGIMPQNITESGFCTACNNDLFFSYRKDKGKTGSLSAVIQLK
ncbi:MAG: peptidoglycan editing factor PgeF [Thermoanaerobacteraceae bacterium]|nr:peptidoglycan editing factor PgeF [Thermoanaerobacteraceae bacterium]